MQHTWILAKRHSCRSPDILRMCIHNAASPECKGQTPANLHICAGVANGLNWFTNTQARGFHTATMLGVAFYQHHTLTTVCVQSYLVDMASVPKLLLSPQHTSTQTNSTWIPPTPAIYVCTDMRMNSKHALGLGITRQTVTAKQPRAV
jgi:hypothetical protein